MTGSPRLVYWYSRVSKAGISGSPRAGIITKINVMILIILKKKLLLHVTTIVSLQETNQVTERRLNCSPFFNLRLSPVNGFMNQKSCKFNNINIVIKLLSILILWF